MLEGVAVLPNEVGEHESGTAAHPQDAVNQNIPPSSNSLDKLKDLIEMLGNVVVFSILGWKEQIIFHIGTGIDQFDLRSRDNRCYI